MNSATVAWTVVPDPGPKAARRLLKALSWWGGLFAVLILSPRVVAAAPHTWNLSGVVFSDGATASGTFTYDSVTLTATNWSISVTPGPNFTALTYTPANSTFSFPPFPLGAGAQPTLQFFIPPFVGGRALRLTPQTVLDGSSTTDPINRAVAGGSGAVECFNCNPFRFITAGSLVFVPPVPVPTLDNGALVALAAVLLLVGALTLRRSAGRALAGHGSQDPEPRPGTPGALRGSSAPTRRFRWPRW
jgi:hypothetical protein